ncbi:MAG: OmpA family protein [Proteobacteria bacterium]|nr:OmpA family protein [Pseudomonadota bacterium]
MPASPLLRFSASLLVLLLATGCVPKAKYDESLALTADLQAEVEATQRALAECDRVATELAGKLEASEGRNAELNALVEQLTAQNTELNGKLGELSAAVAEMSSRNRADKARKAELEALIAGLQESSEAAGESLGAAQERIASLEAEAARLAAEKAALEEKSKAYEDLARELASEIEEGQVTITELSGKLTVSLSNAILFDSGSIALKKEGSEALNKVAGILAQVADKEIRVEGHTDNVPVRSGAAYRDNWDLSSLRASTVVTLLVEGGVDPLNIATVGFGEHHPVAGNEEAEGRAANRRTEIVLVPKLVER